MLLPLEGRRLDGKFRFLSALGSGGMASVYLALNERVDREVAIKFLRPEIGRDAEAVARFRSEARAAGRIGSTHICEILDLGESPLGPYMVMERLRGIDLAALIRRQVRLAPGYAVRVVRHALEGLAAAHEAGIVHRDLKPGNVFLHRTENGDTVVKLMDFGVSKFLDGSGDAETASGILLGTPEYMAPEQLEGAHKIGRPADIWAMGAILYRAITGHQVFSGPTLAAVLKSMALDEVTPLSRLVEGVPPELEAVIHRCLERDPSARYPSAEALSEALAPFEELEGEVTPIAAPEKTRDAVISDFVTPTPEPLPELSTPTQIWSEKPPVAVAAHAEPTPEVVVRKRKGLWIASGLLGLAAVVFAAALMFGPGRREPAPARDPGEQGGELASETAAKAPEVTESSATLDADEAPSEADATETGDPLSDGDDETDTGAQDDTEGGHWVGATDRPAPPGTFRAGPYITPNVAGSSGDQASARRHCEGLAAKAYAGVSNWGLASPTALRKFIGSEIKRGRYWTSALHDGRALVFTMPAGKKASEKADRKIARPLCVAKY
jgi:eukaryotic-like serine/threonine-protein kinase